MMGQEEFTASAPHPSLILLAFQDDFSVLSPAKQLLWSELPTGILPFPLPELAAACLESEGPIFPGYA